MRASIRARREKEAFGSPCSRSVVEEGATWNGPLGAEVSGMGI
jgi:hypothetical protein